MTSTIYSKFFWNDWASDPALRLCSLAAQGLWMRMLCVAAQADRPGFIAVNGRPLDAHDLSRLSGVTPAEVESLLAELDRNGVFSRDRKGNIYNRRMIRDEMRRTVAQKNGSLGGNPNLCNNNGNSKSVNPHVNPVDKTHKPYTRKDAPNGASVDLEKVLFQRGKEVLGSNSGGLIKRLYEAKNKNPAAALVAIEAAATKADAREYVGGMLKEKSEADRWR